MSTTTLLGTLVGVGLVVVPDPLTTATGLAILATVFGAQVLAKK